MPVGQVLASPRRLAPPFPASLSVIGRPGDHEAVTLREHLQAQIDGQKDYFDRRLAEMDLRHQQRFDAQEKASAEALAATEKALSAALRSAKEAAASDLEATKALTARSTQLTDQKFETHNAIRPWVTTIVDAVGNRVEALERRVARFENREEGMSMTTKIIVGFITLVATLVGLYFALKGGMR